MDAEREMNNTAMKSNAIGFMYDFSDLTNEITALNNVKNEYMPALTSGVADPETALAEFNQKLYDAGLQKVIDEKNRQFLEVDSKVFIRGRVSEEDDRPSKLICEKIIPFEQKKRELWIQFPDKEDYIKNEQILFGYIADSEGDDEVVIYCAKEKAIKRLPKNRNILVNPQILSRLMNHFGESRVKVVEKAIENHF